MTGQQVGVFNGTTIPTFYNGVTFRSRLEARWAVFMDHLGVRWFYEHEGFELPSGRYVPDFFLPDLRVFLETKPVTFDLWMEEANRDARRCLEFMELGHDDVACSRTPDAWHPLIVVAGAPSEQDDLSQHRWYQNSSGWTDGDYHYLWCSCPTCGAFGIQFDGRGARVCGPRKHQRAGDKSYSYDDRRIVEAKAASMVWRFC